MKELSTTAVDSTPIRKPSTTGAAQKDLPRRRILATPELPATAPKHRNLNPIMATTDQNFVTKSLRKYIEAMDTNKTGSVDVKKFLEKLKDNGLHIGDQRLKSMFEALYADPAKSIPIDTLSEIAGLGGITVFNALSGRMIIPDFKAFTAACYKIFEEVKDMNSGKNADYIPNLAKVDSNLFSVAVTTVDGQCFSFGDKNSEFCLQSVSKPITYAEAMQQHGVDKVHQHVGREPSGEVFNAMTLKSTGVDEAPSPKGIPHNPCVNAGAIICSSMMSPHSDSATRLERYIKLWTELCGDEVGFDPTVMMSERATADRNMGLAYMLKENRAFLKQKDLNVKEELELYFSTCSLTVTAPKLATAAATLANAGTNPMTSAKVFSPLACRNVLSLMLSCGMYDFSGEWQFTVGLPAKSGVSGALMVVIPNVLGLAIYGPRLDSVGNSVKGIAFTERLVKIYSFHHLDFKRHTKAVDPTVSIGTKKLEQIFEFIYAASSNDIMKILALLDEPNFDVNVGDYDKRTALMVAASEGHVEVVSILLEHGADVTLEDRWGNTAIDDANREEQEDVIAALNGEHRVNFSRENFRRSPSTAL